MRWSFAVLPILLLATGCGDSPAPDAGSAAAVEAQPDTSAAASIALEYGAQDSAAADKAQKQCTVYGRTAKQRAPGEHAKPNVVTFDCV